MFSIPCFSLRYGAKSALRLASSKWIHPSKNKMSSSKEEDRERILRNKAALDSESNTSREVVEVFDHWAEQYERDVIKYGYCMHRVLVDLLDDVIKRDGHVTKSSSVINLAGGTGLVGERLRFRGFTGVVDILEGSSAMLKLAMGKGVYDRSYEHVIEESSPLPPQLHDYDVAIICGALLPNHIHYKCLEQLAACVKPGGLVAFSTCKPTNRSEHAYNMALAEEAFRLEEAKGWELVAMTFGDRFEAGHEETKLVRKAFYYCYKKLNNVE